MSSWTLFTQENFSEGGTPRREDAKVGEERQDF
jgi:hypothetical protein